MKIMILEKLETGVYLAEKCDAAEGESRELRVFSSVPFPVAKDIVSYEVSGKHGTDEIRVESVEKCKLSQHCRTEKAAVKRFLQKKKITDKKIESYLKLFGENFPNNRTAKKMEAKMKTLSKEFDVYHREIYAENYENFKFKSIFFEMGFDVTGVSLDGKKVFPFPEHGYNYDIWNDTCFGNSHHVTQLKKTYDVVRYESFRKAVIAAVNKHPQIFFQQFCRPASIASLGLLEPSFFRKFADLKPNESLMTAPLFQDALTKCEALLFYETADIAEWTRKGALRFVDKNGNVLQGKTTSLDDATHVISRNAARCLENVDNLKRLGRLRVGGPVDDGEVVYEACATRVSCAKFFCEKKKVGFVANEKGGTTASQAMFGRRNDMDAHVFECEAASADALCGALGVCEQRFTKKIILHESAGAENVTTLWELIKQKMS